MDSRPGDSPALRSHGAELRAIAEEARSIASRLEREAEPDGYAGPAAARLREAMTERVARLREVARDFDDLSAVITQDASGFGG